MDRTHVPTRGFVALAGIALIGLAAAHPGLAAVDHPLSIGAVTRHAARYIGKQVTLTGFELAAGKGHVLVSDEARGHTDHYDLPVTGPGIGGLKPRQRYVFTGMLLDHGLKAANGDPVHLELLAPPSEPDHRER